MRALLLLLVLNALSLGFAAIPASPATEVDQIQNLAEWDDLVFEVEDAKCRVGIASLKLFVSTLRPEKGYLIGEYSIVVPLMTSKNDQGLIKLPLHDRTVEMIGKKGGTLRGQAISYQKGKAPNTIVCEVLPLKDQTILLAITTSNRTLNFKSKYTVIDCNPSDG